MIYLGVSKPDITNAEMVKKGKLVSSHIKPMSSNIDTNMPQSFNIVKIGCFYAI